MIAGISFSTERRLSVQSRFRSRTIWGFLMSIFKFRIRGRLYSGFGALVLLVGSLAGFAVWQLWAINAEVSGMKVQSENAIRIGEITTELQATSRSLLNYIHDRDEAS